MVVIIRIFIVLLFIVSNINIGHAFWMWTPETNKWVNPKYAVKATPQEQLQYSLEFFEAQEYELATREFRKLLKHYPKARQAPEAQYYIGRCLEEEGKLMEAFKNYQMVIDKYPFSDLTKKVVEKEYEIGNSLLEGKDQRNKIIKALAGADYDVIELFRTVIKNAPYGDLAPVSQYKIGLYLAEKQLYQEARDEFQKVINDYPDSEWSKAAKYQIAMTDAKRSTDAQYDQKVTEVAVEGLKEFVADNPDAELSGDAKEQISELINKEAENQFYVAEYYEKQKKYQAAKIYFQEIADKYVNTKWAAKALVKIRELNKKIQ